MSKLNTTTEVKNQIFSRLGIRLNEQILKYDSSSLEDAKTLKDHNILLFQQQLKIRVSLLHVKNHKANFFSAKISTTIHNSSDYLLSVEYTTTPKMLYSKVAAHYKIPVKHVFLW